MRPRQSGRTTAVVICGRVGQYARIGLTVNLSCGISTANIHGRVGGTSGAISGPRRLRSAHRVPPHQTHVASRLQDANRPCLGYAAPQHTREAQWRFRVGAVSWA
jgi:hypothetical protein